MSNLIINNWDKWQTYRTDRGTPPWIKVHRNLMTNSEWMILSDAEKGQLVSMWIIAADKDGKIPNNAKLIQKMCGLDAQPDLKKFIENKWITELDANVTSGRQPNDAPETETETETEKNILSDFEIIWKEYSPYDMPTKGNKSKALQSYKKAIKKKGHDELLESVKGYIASCHKGKVKTQHLVTWLNQEGWTTEYEPTKPLGEYSGAFG